MNIDDALGSEIHLKIIRFFHENQASIDTPRGVATWIREDRSKVQKALEDLVGLNILIAHRAPSTTGYSYTQANTVLSKIEKFLKRRKGA
jgi:predicted transcriptional regulator